MPTTHTLVIGAGQAGLAVSRCLTDAAIDHVVLERGHIAERWRSERWDSLQLLSPNWATRLPGWSYQGPELDGFMTADEFATYLIDYAASFDAPIEEGVAVSSVRQCDDGFVVRTSGGTWRATNVVIATGWCDEPRVPALASRLPHTVNQITPSAYRNPGQIPDGAVLVVGASATGVQLADELVRSGREVVLAVGRHSRLPRRYRGLDIWWWLEQIGTFDRTIDQIDDPVQARNDGALQLIGRDDRRKADLPNLQHLGVRLAGRLTGVSHGTLTFADDLISTTTAADERRDRVLEQIDDYIGGAGLDAEVLPATRAVRLGAQPSPARLHLRRNRITTVLWATGYRRPYPWLQVPVLDPNGEIAQRRGITAVSGLYVLGLRFQHRRDSNFIDGVRHDASHVALDIASRTHRHAATCH